MTARELALKIEEGARIAATALQLESLLHGHLAGCDAETTALVLFAADPRPAHVARRPAGSAPPAPRPRSASPPSRSAARPRSRGCPRASSASSCPSGGTLAGALLTGAVALQLLTL